MREVFSRSNEKIKEEKVGDFDEQFKQIEVVDGIEMLKIETEKPNNKNTVLFAPGWSRTIPTFKESLKTLHGLDRDLVTLNHPRIRGGIKRDDSNINTFPKEIRRKATSIYKLIEKEIKNSNKKIDIIAQSLGAVDALLATLAMEEESPGSVENIVLVAPIGIAGKDSSADLKGKFFRKQVSYNKRFESDPSRSDKEKENVRLAGKNFKSYLRKNPLRARNEFNSIINLEIVNLIQKVRNIGVKVAIVQGVDDLMAPTDKVQEKLTNGGLDGFISVKGGHNEIYLKPEKYMALAENILTDLDKKEVKK